MFARGPLEDLVQIVRVGVFHMELEQEAVELRLRQRIGALHFDGILGGENQERPWHRMLHPGHRGMAFLHGLEQGTLGLGRGPVDFVRQDDIGKNGSPLELEAFAAMFVFHDEVGADDVRRHEVRSELDAGEIQAGRARQGTDEGGFSQAGGTLEQGMTLGKKCGQHTEDGLTLANQDFFHLGPELLKRLTKLCGVFFGITSHSSLVHSPWLRRCHSFGRMASK